MNDKIFEIAASTMKVPLDVAKKNFKKLPECNAYYFWNPIRGGVSVIIGESGEKLGAVSRVEFQKHLQAFLEGKRN